MSNRMKKPQPSTVENIQAKQAAPPMFTGDARIVSNLCHGARLGLQHLTGDAFLNVAQAIAEFERAVAQAQGGPKAETNTA